MGKNYRWKHANWLSLIETPGISSTTSKSSWVQFFLFCSEQGAGHLIMPVTFISKMFWCRIGQTSSWDRCEGCRSTVHRKHYCQYYLDCRCISFYGTAELFLLILWNFNITNVNSLIRGENNSEKKLDIFCDCWVERVFRRVCWIYSVTVGQSKFLEGCVGFFIYFRKV